MVWAMLGLARNVNYLPGEAVRRPFPTYAEHGGMIPVGDCVWWLTKKKSRKKKCWSAAHGKLYVHRCGNRIASIQFGDNVDSKAFFLSRKDNTSQVYFRSVNLYKEFPYRTESE